MAFENSTEARASVECKRTVSLMFMAYILPVALTQIAISFKINCFICRCMYNKENACIHKGFNSKRLVHKQTKLQADWFCTIQQLILVRKLFKNHCFSI